MTGSRAAISTAIGIPPPDLASRLIGIPNRYRKRPASLFRNANDSHVKISQECLAFFLCHRGWHARLLTFTGQRSGERTAERPRRAKASQRSAPAGSSTPRRGAVTVWPVSLNDLCSPQEDGLRNGQPERLGGLEVDDQLERSRSLHRQVTRLRAL